MMIYDSLPKKLDLFECPCRKALATRHATNAAKSTAWRHWMQYVHVRRFKTDLHQASCHHYAASMTAAAWSAWTLVRFNVGMEHL